MTKKYDWKGLNEILLNEFKKYEGFNTVAERLGIPYGTVYDAFERGDLSMDLIEGHTQDVYRDHEERPEVVEFRERGNTAILKFKSAEPLTSEEACELAGIDMEVWRIENQEVGMWQVGRKNKKIDLTWTDGKMDGEVHDSGEIKKEYLYRLSVTLARRKRIAVKAVLSPIEVKSEPMSATELPYGGKLQTKVLFICDPHFGLRRRDGDLIPIHHRQFIGTLMKVAQTVLPDYVVWNGDVLDLADWSSFDTEPELMYNTQLAGMELAWVLSQFRRMAGRGQVVVEGNHEVRLKKAIVKNFKASYELKPVNELDGDSLMSVPRFLGMKDLKTVWIDGYPEASVKIGNVRFTHGNVVRKGSAKTISALMTEAAGDKFFGHIHRFELATKYVEDLGRSIWVGSPGCACDKRETPGANANYNWQLGAFLIHIDDDVVSGVEHIRRSVDGPTTFRGFDIQEFDYLADYLKSIPIEYRRQY